MNKIGVVIKRQTMITTLLLFSYGVGVTIVLTVMVIRSEYYRHLYHEVAWDQYSLENVKTAFQKLNFVISEVYPIIDRLNKSRGRPATDRRFQLRFVIWWKLFGPTSQQAAIETLNHSPSLQKILHAPIKPYTRSSLHRFLHLLGEAGFQEIGVTLIKLLIKKDFLRLSRMTIDSFPVYSYLNPKKCYRHAPFNRKKASQIFKQLDLKKIETLFPPQHGLAKSLSDKLKVWLHQYLWDIPSEATNHYLIFSKTGRKKVIGVVKGWKTVATYRNFLKRLESLSNRTQIELALFQETRCVLRNLKLIPASTKFLTLNDLRSVFYSPHRSNDPEISLNYCAAKDHHFFGRGGLIVSSPDLELPLLVRLTPKYKQSEPQIKKFLNVLNKRYTAEIKKVPMIADSEFGTSSIKKKLHEICKTKPRIDNYGNSSKRYRYTPSEKRDLKTNERIIGRLTTQQNLEHPTVYGGKSVAVHLQLAVLSDTLVLWFNLLKQNKSHSHSLSLIKGKKF